MVWPPVELAALVCRSGTLDPAGTTVDQISSTTGTVTLLVTYLFSNVVSQLKTRSGHLFRHDAQE